MVLFIRKYLYGLCCLVALLLRAFSIFGQTIPADNTVAIIRANYLYQFANNSDWPSENKKGPFVVGVVGNGGVGGVGGGGDESGVAAPSKVGQVVLHQQGLLLGGKRLSHLSFLSAPLDQACARRRQRES